MKTKMLSCLLAAALCVLLAGCGTKEPAPVPEPEPAAPAQDAVQPDTMPEPDVTPEPEESPEVQPASPVLPEPAGEDDGVAASYVGTWRDDAWGFSSGRCSMEIDCEDGVNYDINIFWGCSSATARYWHFTGTYDETQEGIVYTGIQFYGTTQFDGSIERSEETEDEAGLIRLEDGVLYWEDMTGRHGGDEMSFNKES